MFLLVLIMSGLPGAAAWRNLCHICLEISNSFPFLKWNSKHKFIIPETICWFRDFLYAHNLWPQHPGADGKFTLYEDEGDNYNYEKGKFSEIQFVWNEADRTLNIAPRKGSYKGMLQHRRFHIVLVGANSGAGDQPMQASKSVEYDGKAVKVQM